MSDINAQGDTETDKAGENRGGDLGGLGGRSPQNLRWGTAHALVPLIFREVLLSDARESMNRVKKGVFLARKGSNMTFNIGRKDREKLGKERENQTNLVDD